MTDPATLKVYGWIGFHADAPGTHRQARFIVAAKSGAAAARAVDRLPRQLDNFGETGNDQELSQARAEPGVVFWRGLNEYRGTFPEADAVTDSTPATAAVLPDQRSLYEQVSDLWRFARQQKMYDAQDWLATHWTGHPLPHHDLDDLCPLCANWRVNGECGCPV